jgi:hypothetical protein
VYTDAYDSTLSADNDVDFFGEACTHAVVLSNLNVLYLLSLFPYQETCLNCG